VIAVDARRGRRRARRHSDPLQHRGPDRTEFLALALVVLALVILAVVAPLALRAG
jgi:hypothetical protein